MKYLDLTLPTPEANLACDEALLDLCENSSASEEVLRFWQPTQPFVVVGYANRIADEVDLRACQNRNVPVLRRCTGGGTVLQGAGCLNYSLIFKITEGPPHHNISSTNAHIMRTHSSLLSQLLGTTVSVEGSTDLAVAQLKFSGNAQRRKRAFLLFHGTFLLDFDLALIEALLPLPSKQPDYRQNRRHRDFVRNVDLPAPQLKQALRQTWQACETFDHVPWAVIDQLAKQRYATPEWNFKF